ncbi:MAG: NAD-dependent epimerase/dehydratase family protein [Caldilinea sp. CFX5]|nr:NAD-dependent epimerase/dehydratase family protein [Caldilinea sp. CFX5]
MSVYLVTGGAGFIGSNLVHELLQRGETVRVLDNFSTGRRSNLADVYGAIDLIEGDLRSSESCRQAIKGVDVVLHQGALPSVQRSVSDPFTSHDTNATATMNLLVAARDAGVKRFVYASSSSVYGDSPTMPKQEEMTPRPKSPYAVAKLAGEHYCRIFYELYGLETVCLRYFNVFGPYQDPTSHYSAVIPLFIRAMMAGRAPTIYGDGTQSRDFTFVQNNVHANLLAATQPGVGGQIFNIACGQRYSLIDLMDALNEILGTAIEPTFDHSRRGDVKHSLADIQRAQDLLGYTVQVDFLEGLRRTAAWYRTHDN